MNPCDNIKDLIVVDYGDDLVSQATRQLIDAHLLECADCRLFAQDIKKTLTIPFNSVVREKVPETLWASIKENIINEERLTVASESFLSRMIKNFLPRYWVPAFASFAVIVLIGTFIFRHQQLEYVRDQEQGEYLVTLLGDVDNLNEIQDRNLELPIEEYFL